MRPDENIEERPIENELRSSFLDYAMSVITSRALPDVRDGLKPVHRRILYAMSDLGMTHSKPYNKSARIVGDVIGKYHPHGDSSVYDALVRLAQEWNMLAPLVEGQGNFGSMDGDRAAAMRYTEARMAKLTEELLNGLKKDTVDFRDNYDGRNKEPVVLPAKFPQLLVNGTSGIAVGMASHMVSHNLREVVEGIIAQINNPDITIDELMKYIKGPDFPTAGTIFGEEGIEKAFKTGRGTIIVRGKAHIEEIDGSAAIVITQLPYQVGKHTIKEEIRTIQHMYDEFKNKNRGQKKKRFYVNKPKKALDFAKKDRLYEDNNKDSTEDNMRIIVELKKGVDAQVVLNHLYKYTSLQTTISINNTALIPTEEGKTRPRCLNLKQMVGEYIKHQKEVFSREAAFDLKKHEKEFRELEGLTKALKELDRTLKIIRQADTDQEAIDGLMNLLKIDKDQAVYIMDRKIRSISNMEQSKIKTRADYLNQEVSRLKEILENEEVLKTVIINHLERLKEDYGKDRKTAILPPVGDITIEDLIQNERVVVTVSNNGYIKTTMESNYKTQRRNGRGVNSMGLDDDDFVKHLDILYKHDHLLLFTDHGKVYSLKGYDIPETQSNAKGIHIFNLLPGLEDEEQIQSVVSVKDFSDELSLFFTTAKGKVKKTSLADYKNIRRTGIVAIKFEEEKDRLVNVSLTNGTNNIVLVTRFGQAIKFSETEIRQTSRDTQGVKGISLRKDDYVISSDIEESFGDLFVITEYGYGKRTPLNLFKTQIRGGVGVKAIKTNDKTGNVVGALIIDSEDAVYVLSTQGSLIKLRAESLSQFSRNAQGTKVINLRENDSAQTIARLSDQEQEDDDNTEE
ncbi:DNA topoisomerase 4 subunit A [Priestia megaterium]|uniref:DNA topoisomerase (ATP-hydrolyzing) n=1 Tax=Priestia megaterium TaxID=1404 RepID=UPI002E222EB7|nr:DNA topoisomerase (ATP-hydrolyzing) [Priestia megaterium]MED4285545.1 DNA topoisomerase 4 subunit A [Priestia megaterium]